MGTVGPPATRNGQRPLCRPLPIALPQTEAEVSTGASGWEPCPVPSSRVHAPGWQAGSAPSGNLCKLPHNLGPAGSCWRTFPSVCVRSSFCSLLSRRGDSRALQWRCSAPKLLRYCPAGCRVFSCVGRSGNVFGFFTFEFFSIWALQ